MPSCTKWIRNFSEERENIIIQIHFLKKLKKSFVEKEIQTQAKIKHIINAAATRRRSCVLEPEKFNSILMDWLVWYNCERPHYAHKLETPLQFLFLLSFSKTQQECNYRWTDTYT